jgi:peptidyl-prolyl cis-trans isomerase SurA
MNRNTLNFAHTFFALFFITSPASSAELIDRIVASVDHHVILWSELNYRLRFEMETQGISPYAPQKQIDNLRTDLLESMVDEKVLILKAQKDSLQIDPSEVEDMLSQQFNLARNNLSDTEFDEMLSRIGLNERQLKARYRTEIRHRLLYRQMRSLVSYRQHITHKDVETYRKTIGDTLPEQISLSNIRLAVRPDSSVLTSKLQTAENLYQRLAEGEVFEKIATETSEDPGSARNGGNLGCFERGTLVPEFEEAAFKLNEKEISKPVLSQYGYHLILLNEKRENAICASHILISAQTTELDKSRAQKKMESLRKRSLEGEDFGELARTYSDDPNSSLQGGLWGTFPKDQIPAFLNPYIQNLKLGQVSEPFFLQGDWFIFKLNDDQSTIEAIIREIRTEQAMNKMIREYREQIHIETRLENEFLREPNYDASRHIPEANGPN